MIERSYKDNKKICTPFDVYVKIGETPTPEWIAKILKIPVSLVNEEAAKQDRKMKEEGIERSRSSELKKSALKNKIMSGDPIATIEGSHYFFFEPWFVQKSKNNLGKWYEYRTKLSDLIEKDRYDLCRYICNKKENWDWILECPFVAEMHKDHVRGYQESSLKKEEKNKISIGDILTGTLRPGKRGDPILTNTGKEHPIIIVNKAPKDQIGKKARVKILRKMERIIIGEYVSGI